MTNATDSAARSDARSMTKKSGDARPTPPDDDPAPPPLTPEIARQHLEDRALVEGEIGLVGLELEAHLVDLDRPAVRVSYARIRGVLANVPILPGGSAVTVEPGGQVELSTPPAHGVTAAVRALRRDREILATHLLTHRLGLATLGSDPARVPQRVNPAGRYVAMEEHFAATGQAAAGQAMMCSSASLQLNLEAGPAKGWSDRVHLAHHLGPVLVAISACSPWLAGRTVGWRSTRQQIWGQLDQARCGPLPNVGPPAQEWAAFALCAPVMLVRSPDGHGVEAVRERVSFASWISQRVKLGGRRPTVADLDYHLTTLFPPARLRGFLELRFLDAVPLRWWPALAAITATLLDDPRAASIAAEACEPVAHAWERAAHAGVTDPELAIAARRCIEAAATLAPPGLRAEINDFAELVAGSRTPGDAVNDRAREVGPLRVLEEQARE